MGGKGTGGKGTGGKGTGGKGTGGRNGRQKREAKEREAKEREAETGGRNGRQKREAETGGRNGGRNGRQKRKAKEREEAKFRGYTRWAILGRPRWNSSYRTPHIHTAHQEVRVVDVELYRVEEVLHALELRSRAVDQVLVAATDGHLPTRGVGPRALNVRTLPMHTALRRTIPPLGIAVFRGALSTCVRTAQREGGGSRATDAQRRVHTWRVTVI